MRQYIKQNKSYLLFSFFIPVVIMTFSFTTCKVANFCHVFFLLCLDVGAIIFVSYQINLSHSLKKGNRYFGIH